MESDLVSNTSCHFKRLLVALCNAKRDESDNIGNEPAIQDAITLLEAAEKRAGTDESAFNIVFCQRNFAQIKLVRKYKYFSRKIHRLFC